MAHVTSLAMRSRSKKGVHIQVYSSCKNYGLVIKKVAILHAYSSHGMACPAQVSTEMRSGFQDALLGRSSVIFTPKKKHRAWFVPQYLSASYPRCKSHQFGRTCSFPCSRYLVPLLEDRAISRLEKLPARIRSPSRARAPPNLRTPRGQPAQYRWRASPSRSSSGDHLFPAIDRRAYVEADSSR